MQLVLGSSSTPNPVRRLMLLRSLNLKLSSVLNSTLSSASSLLTMAALLLLLCLMGLRLFWLMGLLPFLRRPSCSWFLGFSMVHSRFLHLKKGKIGLFPTAALGVVMSTRWL